MEPRQSKRTIADSLLALVAKAPVRAGDLARAGIPRSYLTRFVTRGILERVDRGLYRLADGNPTEVQSLVDVAKRVPDGVICLLSALQVHELTTQAPHAVWLMIDTHRRPPRIRTPKLEIVRASGKAREHGVVTKSMESVAVRITTPAKTVADCFRYRKYVGLDVALEALRDFVAQSKKRRGPTYSVDALMKAAEADNVVGIIRPYLEALA